MANIYVKSGSGTEGSGAFRGLWSASKTWAVGDRIVATNVVSYRVMECTTGGAGGAGAEPTWNTTTGGTTNDGAAVWTTRIPSTWANATTHLHRALANDAAGDYIYVSNNHSESNSSSPSYTIGGTEASPIYVICADDSSEPPTTTATTGAVAVTSGGITWGDGNTRHSYVYGVSWVMGSGASSDTFNPDVGITVFDSCAFTYVGTGSSRLNFATAAGGRLVYKNCSFKFGGTGQYFRDALSALGDGTVVGGSIISGSSAITTLVGSMVNGSSVRFSGFDLSNAATGVNLFSGAGASTYGMLRDCKLPASWSGSLYNGTPGKNAVFEMFNCDSGDTNYRYRKAAQFGTIQDETTLVRTGGASDEVTAISYKMVTNANAEFPMLTLDMPELHQWNDTTGSAITATVEILHDSATALTDKEVWLEVMYLGTSGYPLGSFATDTVDVLATAANQASSSATWTTTGMANPNKQALSVTFTPQEKGYIVATVRLAKASKTVYVCPKIDIT